jgi:hypothetical protein
MDGKIFSAMRQALIIPGPGRLGVWSLTVQRLPSNLLISRVVLEVQWH